MGKIISLLTDFGNIDGFVGIMKGVVCNIYSEATFIDLSNDIQSCSIFDAAWILGNSYPYFPEGTIFLCVVDPGVGSKRKKIAIKTDKYYFVGPDNGIFSYIYQKEKVEKIINITNSKYWLPKVSNTFHGRDIFAPVVGHLARDPQTFDDLGEAVNTRDLYQLEVMFSLVENNTIIGNIIHIDKFGNLITNISADMIENKRIQISFKDLKINQIDLNYSAKKTGEVVALIGSHGNLEISVCKGNAKEFLQTGFMERVYVDILRDE